MMASLRRRWREFWTRTSRDSGSAIAERGDGICRLAAAAPTVLPEETAKLRRKGYGGDWHEERVGPIDYDNLPGA